MNKFIPVLIYSSLILRYTFSFDALRSFRDKWDLRPSWTTCEEAENGAYKSKESKHGEIHTCFLC